MLDRLALLAVLAGPTLAEPVPGMRGVTHIGITVPYLAQAERFFADVMGCQKAMCFGPFRDDKGTFMQDVLSVDPRAVIEQITLMRCGFGSNIELFKDTAADQQTVALRNSDIGSHHIAFYVDDIDAVAAYLKTSGLTVSMGAIQVSQGPTAGRSILYFSAPWGLQLEAISYPKGMAYEANGGPMLWANTDPAK